MSTVKDNQITLLFESVFTYFLYHFQDRVSVCVCLQQEMGCTMLNSPFQPNLSIQTNRVLWPFTKINIPCDPWSKLDNSMASRRLVMFLGVLDVKREGGAV